MHKARKNLGEAEIKKMLEQKLKLLQAGEYDKFQELQAQLHQRAGGTYIGDVIFAANDGIVTTFAVVAGAAGGGLSIKVILILGFANLLADGLAMGLGNFLGSRSERDYARHQRKIEAWEIEKFRPVEIAEVERVFHDWGFQGQDLKRATEIITSDKKRWIDFMMLHELDIIEDPIGSPAKHGLVTFISFALAGLLPLLPFLFPHVVQSSSVFGFSILATAVALFGVGASRVLVTTKNWFSSGLEMLLVGSIAAVVAYFIGDLISTIVSKF